MNKKEISEIKKQFTPENCSLTRICGCYVDGEKNKKTELKEAFLSLSEEEMFKYFEIFRKSLSGTIGKNLMNMEFPLEQETEGGTQHFLMKLRESKLTDDALVESFYDKIIENYDYPENYYIILIHGVYDIPGKSSDGAEMFDASDEIYEHIMCCICPVKLSKAGLCYNAETNSIQDRIRDWIVELPDVAFLFPQFNDRSTDIHGVLYYSKNANELRDIFIDELLGCTAPLSAGGQRDSFNALVEDTLGDDCRYDTVLSIHEKLNDLIESQKDEPEPVVLTKSEVKRLFEECGVEDEKLQSFDEQYEITAGEKSSLVASNITNTKRFEIKTPDVVVHVDPERADLVETRVIDGRKCLVIPMEGEVELMEYHKEIKAADVDALVATYFKEYDHESSLEDKSTEAYQKVWNAAKAELALRAILKAKGAKGFTTNFDDLGDLEHNGFDQIPGLASQRLMAEGYGFGAEGDWKSAALYRTVWVMNQGLPKGCSFLEDYTLNFDGAQSSILQSHMLEVCPLIAANRPRLEVHFLGIGIRKSQTARLVFTSKVGTGCTATVVDLGNRFRLIVNDVECIEPKPLPKLPVASALWIPMPDFEVGAGAWILAGGTHHSCFSYDLTAEYWEDYAEIAGIEMVHINKDTTISCFKKELRMNEVYYMLNKALC